MSGPTGETFHLTPVSKVVGSVLWLVLAALLGALLSIVVRMNEKQSDWNGMLSGALVEIRQAREDTNRVERNQEGIHNHVVSVDTYAHDNVARLDRRIDEVERSRSRK